MTADDFADQFMFVSNPPTPADAFVIVDILTEQGDALLCARVAQTVDAHIDHGAKLATAHEMYLLLGRAHGGNSDDRGYWSRASQTFWDAMMANNRKICRLERQTGGAVATGRDGIERRHEFARAALRRLLLGEFARAMHDSSGGSPPRNPNPSQASAHQRRAAEAYAYAVTIRELLTSADLNVKLKVALAEACAIARELDVRLQASKEYAAELEAGYDG